MARASLVVGILCVLAPAARADMAYMPPQPTPPPNDDFWRDVVTPHADEIADILAKANQAYSYAISNCAQQDCDATGEMKQKLLDDTYYMLRYARKLDPNQADVLLLLGKVAEESGRPAAAIEALQAYEATLPADTLPNADSPLHLGRAFLRFGRTQDAIREFRAAMAGGNAQTGGPATAAGAYLGMALMNEGRTSDAIEALLPVVPNANWYGAEVMEQGLTLAVAYDRDEQLSATFSLLDNMQQQTTTYYPTYAQNAIVNMEFVPAYDQHYYQALFYESQGYFDEARTEWMHYAEVPDAPFRGRALDHVKAIDKLEGQKLRDAAKAAADAAKAAKKHKGKGGTTVVPPPPPPQYPYGQPIP